MSFATRLRSKFEESSFKRRECYPGLEGRWGVGGAGVMLTTTLAFGSRLRSPTGPNVARSLGVAASCVLRPRRSKLLQPSGGEPHALRLIGRLTKC